MEKKNEKKILFFDETEFEKAKVELESLRKDAQWLADTWAGEPLLKRVPFTQDVFKNLLKKKADFITGTMKDIIRKSFEDKLEGLSEQVDLPSPKVKCDLEKVDRIIGSLNGQTKHRDGRASAGMLTVDEKGNVSISDKTIGMLTDKYCVFDDGDAETMKTFTMGKMGAECLNYIQDKINTDAERLKKRTGFRPAYTMDVFPGKPREGMVMSPGEAARNSAFYQQDGKYYFNIKKFLK